MNQLKKINPSRANIEFQVNAMKVVELRKQLKARGCDTNGLLKKELRTLLVNVMAEDLDGVDCQVFLQSSKLVQPESKKSNRYEDSEQEKISEAKALGENGTYIVQHGFSDMVAEPIDERGCSRASISSMQVELNTAETDDSNDENTDQVVETTKSVTVKSPVIQSQAQAPAPNSTEAKSTSTVEISKPVSNGSSTDSNNTPQSLDAAKLEKIQSCTIAESFKFKLEKKDSPRAACKEISPPASEVSSVSKSSVKDMVSKFSSFSGQSSTATASSALSKSLQLKKEARMARMAEMREKVSP
jgi:hypothetical protein